MKTQNGFANFFNRVVPSNAGLASFYKNYRLPFWLLIGGYLWVIWFFRSYLSGPSVVYVVINFVIVGYIVFKFYQFFNSCNFELTAIVTLSGSFEKFIAGLKKIVYNSRTALQSSAIYDEIRSIFSHSPRAALIPQITSDVLLRHRAETTLEMDEIMANTVEPFFDKMHSLANAGASLCVAIGLLGTFSGMLHSIDDNITIAKLIGGLNEAIGSSLIGVLSAIFLTLLTKVEVAREALLRHEITNFVLGGLFPRFQLKTNIIIDDKAAEIMGTKIGQALSKQLKEVLSEPIRILNEKLDSLAQAIAALGTQLERHHQDLEEVVRGLGYALRTWSDLINNISHTFEDMRDSLNNLTKELAGNLQIVQVANDQLMKTLRELKSISEILTGDLKDWIQQNPAKAIEQHIETISDSAEKLSDTIAGLNATITGHMDTFIRQAAAQWSPTQELLSKHQNQLGNFVTGITQVGSVLKTLQGELTGAIKQLAQITAQLDEDENVKKKLVRIERRSLERVQTEIYERIRNGTLHLDNGRIVERNR